MPCDWDVDWLGDGTKFDDMYLERRAPRRDISNKKTGRLEETTARLSARLWTLPLSLWNEMRDMGDWAD